MVCEITGSLHSPEYDMEVNYRYKGEIEEEKKSIFGVYIQRIFSMNMSHFCDLLQHLERLPSIHFTFCHHFLV